jgi:polyisoprenoid-binding protein YceI
MRARHGTSIARAGLLALVPLLAAATPANTVLTLQPASTLTVAGTSTLRSFTCAATGFTTAVATTGADAVRGVIAGERVVTGADVALDVAALDCRNGTMNSHMHKALRSTEHPTIAFRMTGYESARSADGATGTVTGVLTLAGVQKSITMRGGAAAAPGGALRVTGTHVVRMTDYGIKPPSLMLGRIKVGEDVTVSFDLLLKD